MKVKIFTTTVSTDDLENQIAKWTDELNPEIISVNVNAVVMYDYFMDSAPPRICNQWNEYIATIIYKLSI